VTWPNWNAGVQFPTADQEAWNQATRARYDEFDTLENVLLQADAGGQAIDRIGPVVALTNSAGGWRAMMSAIRARGDNMKGIVAYETPGFVFPQGEGPEPQPKAPFGPNSVPLDEFMKLTKFPIQLVFGDYTDTGPIWADSVKLAHTFCDIVNRHGGDCEVLRLPDVGLHGNTHIAFADLNNEAVADELSKWLQRRTWTSLPENRRSPCRSRPAAIILRNASASAFRDCHSSSCCTTDDGDLCWCR
jgi:hypothetical protein